MTVVGFVLYGSLVLLPLWLQTLLGYPSLQAGIALAPRGLGSMLGMPIVGALVGKFDPRRILAMGLAVGAFTLYEFSKLNLQAGYWDFFWPQFLQGAGMALGRLLLGLGAKWVVVMVGVFLGIAVWHLPAMAVLAGAAVAAAAMLVATKLWA